MKSTGEVLGIGKNLQEALYKGLLAAGYKMSKKGGVFITVRPSDKDEIADIARKFALMGFELYATKGTGDTLRQAGLAVQTINKIYESDENNSMTILESGRINYIISTSAKGRDPARDSVKIRRKASILRIPCLTSLDTANAIADSLLSNYNEINTELIDINNLRSERMALDFTKMEANGNDCIFIDCFNNVKEHELNSPESLSAYLCDRNFGVGGTGIVLILPSRAADAKIRVFNLDGSEAEACGSPLRCAAKYLYDKRLVTKNDISIEMKSGIKNMYLETQNGLVCSVISDMGKAEIINNEELIINNEIIKFTAVSVGNPHCVIFLGEDDILDAYDVEKTGMALENNKRLFPERTNVEFIKIISRNIFKMRVWERGNGETLASGTGACAAVAAAVRAGLANEGEDIKVIQPGGELIINYTGDAVYMTGGCREVFEGTVLI